MTTSIGLNLRVTGHCNQGQRKYMEDAFVVAYQQSEDQKDLVYAFFGIFDGHGGREAALFAKEHLMNNIVNQKSFWSEDDNLVLKAIRDGFLATHHAMWREVGKWPKTVSGLPSTSGTTSSIAFIRRRKLYIGHVGDSKIVLGYQLPGSPEWCACALTKDHKPESPEEKKRINSVGGLVINKAGVERVVWNRPRLGHKGPVRRSTAFDQIPFLAVARSLGDLWSYNYTRDEFVVSPDPDVKVININPHMHRCVIFASDGLWNMLSTHRAVKIVQRVEEENEKLILEGGKTSGAGKQPTNPSKLLVDAALSHWFQNHMRADNTSVVTVMLDPPGPPKSEVLLRQRVMKRLRPRDEQTDEAGEDTQIPISSTEKKKRFEACDSQSLKERKRSSDGTIEIIPKERKLSLEIDEMLAFPRNLPKPVILSPQRVMKPSASPSKTADSEKDDVNPDTCSSVPAFKVKKKGHDPPKGGFSNSPIKEVENENSEAIKTPLSNNTKPGKGSDNSPLNKGSVHESAVESSHNTVSSKSEPFPVSEKSKSTLSKDVHYSSLKENGRVHLCEVDNIFKLNDRTTECFDSSPVLRQRVMSPKSKTVPSEVKNFRKTTLSRRTTGHSNVRKQRRTFVPCRVISLRKSYAHNTRAQSSIHKLKV